MIEYDEFGNPRYPGYVPPQDPYLQQVEQQTQPPPVGSAEQTPPAPYQIDPQKYLKEAYGIGTTGPKADQAAQNATDYKANQGAQFDALGQNPPQQFETAETTDYSSSPDEGPLSPKATAEAMPTNKDYMTELINKHMLPSVPQSSRDGYANYVTASREKRAAEKEQLRQQGSLNRADAADKDARAMDQTYALNGLQGAGPAAGGGQSSFGGGGRVQKIGGYTFVRGQWRPESSQEAAHTRLLNSQADYMGSRAGIESGKDISLDERLATRIAATAAENDKRLGAQADREGNRQQSAADKQAQAVRGEFDKFVNALRKRDEDAAKQVETNTPSKLWNYVPGSEGSKPPYREQYLDQEYNPKTKKFDPAKETYSSMKDRALMLADQLEKLHNGGADVGTMPDDVIDYVTQLRNSKGAQ